MAFPDFPVVLLLMGLPGSGKTTLGRWLEHHLSTTHTEGLQPEAALCISL